MTSRVYMFTDQHLFLPQGVVVSDIFVFVYMDMPPRFTVSLEESRSHTLVPSMIKYNYNYYT